MNPMMPGVMNKEIVFDLQLSLAKVLEVRKFNFYPDAKHNPLMPLNLNKSECFLPKQEFSYDFSNNVCNNLLYTYHNPIDRKSINCVKFSNYSKRLFAANSAGNVVVLDLSNSISFYQKFSNIHPFTSIRSMEIDIKNTVVLTGDTNGNIIVSDNDFRPLNTLKVHANKEPITDISLSPNDCKFVTSSDDKFSKIIDLKTGEEEITYAEHGSDIKTCNWNPYRSLICTGGKDNLIKFWDPRNGETITSMHFHKDTINRLRFHSNGNWLLSGSKDYSVKVSDIRMMKIFQTFKGHEQEVNVVAWHPKISDMFVSAGADGQIIHWNVNTNNNYIHKSAHDKEIFDLAFSSVGSLLVSGSNDQSIKVSIRS